MSTNLDDCGCCEDASLDPTSVENPAGRSALSYRIGTQPTFLARMLTRLTTQELPDGDHAGDRPLRSLTTRELSDPTIALLDAFACVADVLTFYQERIANECFLGTATERRSILELATMVGYELDPGVAARAWLAFTLDDAPSSPETVTIRTELPVMSVPGPDEVPQIFETVEERTLRVAWNALEAATTLPQTFTSARSVVWLSGTATNLRVGDRLLFCNAGWAPGLGTNEQEVRTVSEVRAYPGLQLTRVVLSSALSAGLDADDDVEVFVLRKSSRLYGATAQPWMMLDQDTRDRIDPATSSSALTEWPAITDFAAVSSHTSLHLEREQDGLAPGNRFVVLWRTTGGTTGVHVGEVSGTAVESQSDLGYAATVTKVSFTSSALGPLSLELRSLLFLFGAEELALGEEPLTDADGELLPVTSADLTADGLRLDGEWDELEVGRKVHLTATGTDGETTLSMLLTLEGVEVDGDSGTTTVTFEEELPADVEYDRATVRVNANVVLATHGETVVREVLGSGDGKIPNQSFVLKKANHTWVPDTSTDGRAPTFSVEVNGVEWTRVDSLYAQDAAATVYTLRTDDDAVTTVTFGDGEYGARLPTGTENVIAKYRAGIGLDGEVPATKLMLLKKRPLGVRSVTNPEDAWGAEDPETMEDARAAIPATTRALERVVSVQDFEDYARTYPGIGKALASRLWDGEREVVHLTVAAASGDEPDADQVAQLEASLRAAGDPTVRGIEVQAYEVVYFATWLDITVSGDAEEVLTAVEEALLAAFDFEERSFGQAVLAAELLAVAHSVAGVTSVVVRELATLPDDDPDGENPEGEALAARAAARELPETAAPTRLAAASASADPDAAPEDRFTAAQLLLPHHTWGLQLTEASS